MIAKSPEDGPMKVCQCWSTVCCRHFLRSESEKRDMNFQYLRAPSTQPTRHPICDAQPIFCIIPSRIQKPNPPKKNIWVDHLTKAVGAANSKLAPDRTVLTETKLYPGSHLWRYEFLGSTNMACNGKWIDFEGFFFCIEKWGIFQLAMLVVPEACQKSGGFKSCFSFIKNRRKDPKKVPVPEISQQKRISQEM